VALAVAIWPPNSVAAASIVGSGMAASGGAAIGRCGGWTSCMIQ
jgi:hypothetical protein